jgi:hypothetical protein
MRRKFDQNLQSLIAGQFLVEIAVGLFRGRESGKAFDLFFHRQNIRRPAVIPSTN